MDSHHTSRPYLEGTIAAAESNYLAGWDIDQMLEGVNFDDIDNYDEQNNDFNRLLDPLLYPQETPQAQLQLSVPGPSPKGVAKPSPGGVSFDSVSYGSTDNIQPLQINTNVQPSSYQPNYHYPDAGLAGRNGPPEVHAYPYQMSQYPITMVPTGTDAQGRQQFTPTQYFMPYNNNSNGYGHAPPPQNPCPPPGYYRAAERGDGARFRTRRGAPNGYPGPDQYGHQPVYQQPAPPQGAEQAKKRKRRDSFDPFNLEDTTGITRRANGKVQHDRALKQRGDIACDPDYVYTDPLPLVENWRKRGGGGPHFQYTPFGQWIDHLDLSAAELRHYLDNCPRDVKILVQQPPAQSNSRQQDCDRRCRYAHCPVESKSLRPGFLRVAFDEYYDLTSDGRKDPFKVAGCMHLWCFEQCVDPYEFCVKKMLLPDDRVFPREAKNPMAINRDSDKGIVNAAFKPWMIAQHHKKDIPPEIPRDHKDSLTYALVVYHLHNQVTARQNCRDRRNKDKPDAEKNTLDIHMGDVGVYARRCREIRGRKRGTKRRRTKTPYEDGITFVAPKECGLPYTGGLVNPMLAQADVPDHLFKGSVRSRRPSPIKLQEPVSAEFEHYVPLSQESPKKRAGEDMDLMQQGMQVLMQREPDSTQLREPNSVQVEQQPKDTIIVQPEQPEQPGLDGFDFLGLPSSEGFKFLGRPPSEESSLVQPPQPESDMMQLDSSNPPAPVLPKVEQPQPLPLPMVLSVLETWSPEANAGPRKRSASELDAEDNSLFGSPRSKRSRGSVASQNGERQGQGAPLRRSPRQSLRVSTQ
ncbi:hypothetical protein ACHAPT_002405 [Fusarium lateritium]